MRLRWIALFLLVFTLSFFGNQGGYQLLRLKKKTYELKKTNRELVHQNAAFVEEIHRLHETDYLERLIREETGSLREGELLLEIPKSP